MSKSVKDVLIEARKLIEKPENWTQGVLARNANGRPVTMLSEKAVCWCMSGAIGKVVDGDPYRWDRAIEELWPTTCRAVTDFNDAEGRTHAEVLEAFSRAIAAADAQETAQ